MKKGDPVEVKWVDSTRWDGWQSEWDDEEILCYLPIISVGIFIRRTRDYILLSLSKSRHHYQGQVAIPICCVASIKPLKLKSLRRKR